MKQTRNVSPNSKNASAANAQGPSDLKKQAQKTLLQKSLGLTPFCANKLLEDNKFLSEFTVNRLLGTLNALRRFNLEKKDIYQNPNCLKYVEQTIEHSSFYLKDAGFQNVNAQMLVNFRSIVKRPITLLKSHSFITGNVNVAKRMCSRLDPNPIASVNLKLFNDNSCIGDIHQTILKKYFGILGATESQAVRIILRNTFLTYKSLYLISEMVQFLRDDFGFHNDKILKNVYVFNVSPTTVRMLLHVMPKIANVDTKQIFTRHLKLMCMPLDNFTEMSRCLKEFNISEEAIQKCFEIFTLSPETVANRLQELERTPDFAPYIKNPRVLQLVLSQKKVKARLELLKKQNIKCASLNLLCASDIVFEKYMQEGNDRTKGFDVVQFLNLELNLDRKYIRERLGLNPHWYHIPVIHVMNNLLFLREKGFDDQSIATLIPILLYPKEQLEDTLKEIAEKVSETDTSVNQEQQLSLSLYTMEKKYHFSGNGIWIAGSRGTNKNAATIT